MPLSGPPDYDPAVGPASTMPMVVRFTTCVTLPLWGRDRSLAGRGDGLGLVTA